MDHALIFLLLLIIFLPEVSEGSKFVVVPAGKGLSPGMDVMAVAGELQIRSVGRCITNLHEMN